jgi:hypothetical protein
MRGYWLPRLCDGEDKDKPVSAALSLKHTKATEGSIAEKTERVILSDDDPAGTTPSRLDTSAQSGLGNNDVDELECHGWISLRVRVVYI